jgi:hypothetical protein
MAWLILAMLGLSVSLHAAVAIPNWMRQAADQPLASYPPDTNAIVLLDETENVVTGPGDYVEHYRRVVRILRREGRREGSFYVGLQKQEKLVTAHAWSIDKSGHEYEVKDKEFTEQSPYMDELYSDFHVRTAEVPAADPGSVVGFEYEVRKHGWLNQFHWTFQEDIPVREARFRLQLPGGWEYKTAWANTKPVPEEQTPQGSQWVVHDVPAIEDEERMPAPFSLCGRAEIAYFAPGGTAVASWDGLGRWYAELTAGRRNASPELADKAHQLTAGKTDFDGKVRALASFLQTDVRYVAIEIGIGGYQPHPAGDIFHARYGDCKDKATLLSTMLKEVGIDSDYVLIHTERGVVKPELPSSLFNHAILAIELPSDVSADLYRSVWTGKSGKRYLIFDPTDEYTQIGMLRGDLQDTNALLVTDGHGELIHTPLLSPETNLLSRTGHFTLDSNGALSGELVENSNGDHASRARMIFVHANQQERMQQLERNLNESLKGFTLQSADLQQLDQPQKDLILTLKLAVPEYGQLRGPLMLIRPRVLGEKSFDIDHRKQRLYPVALHSPSRETDTYEIDLPKDFIADDIPDPVKIDMGFASYQSKIEVSGSKLRYWREYVVRDLSVNANRFAELRQFEGRIGAEENAVVVLKRVQ